MQTCLIVDDSSVIRKVGTRILLQLGLAVDSAASAAEALALMAGGPIPDIVIASASLPDMGGEEFVRALRAQAGGAPCTILAALVEFNLGPMTRMKRAGANGFVYKPFDRRVMTKWLEPHLARVA